MKNVKIVLKLYAPIAMNVLIALVQLSARIVACVTIVQTFVMSAKRYAIIALIFVIIATVANTAQGIFVRLVEKFAIIALIFVIIATVANTAQGIFVRLVEKFAIIAPIFAWIAISAQTV